MSTAIRISGSRRSRYSALIAGASAGAATAGPDIAPRIQRSSDVGIGSAKVTQGLVGVGGGKGGRGPAGPARDALRRWRGSRRSAPAW
ncbi:hypothetical protein Adu01nite_16530 [Paractinoplanes durhamensis]|uniref:Uncharacterized protein n=1 Tax=Paractinoplanes durhamensis TaxID=113563 RepID=A0ABQ3YRU2_9ACTN|nr:hypothetical protein Adu01nite_16530 [Actinoplanes durhamensis]